MLSFFQSLAESFKDRLKNPFLGAFILSWIVFNWKGISVFIYSDKGIEAIINNILCHYSNGWDYFGYPFIFAAMYVGGMQYFMWLFDKISKKGYILRKEHQKDLILKDLELKQDIAVEEEELEKKKAGYRDTELLNQEIATLRDQLAKRGELVDELRSELRTIGGERTSGKSTLTVKKMNEDIEVNDEELDKEYNRVKTENWFRDFPTVVDGIKNQGEYPHGTNFMTKEKFENEGIVMKVPTSEEAVNTHSLTSKGEYFWSKYMKEYKGQSPESNIPKFD